MIDELITRMRTLLEPLKAAGDGSSEVWANAIALSLARRKGQAAYAAVLAELETLSATRWPGCGRRTWCCCGSRSPASGSACRRRRRDGTSTRPCPAQWNPGSAAAGSRG